MFAILTFKTLVIFFFGGGGVKAKTVKTVVSQQNFLQKAPSQKQKVGGGEGGVCESVRHSLKALVSRDCCCQSNKNIRH